MSGSFQLKDVVERQGLDYVNAARNSNTSTCILKGASPLFAAAVQCNLPLVMELIDRRESNTSMVNNKYSGLTPLHAAVSWNRSLGFEKRKPVIEFLVSKGADLSSLTDKGSPLWTLCPRNEPALMMLLINLGMSLTQQCPLTGNTVLHHWASGCGPALNKDSVAVVELLLANGADLKALNNCGFTPLNVAAIGSSSNKLHGHPNDPVLRCLFHRDDINPFEKIDALELAGAIILLAQGFQSKFIHLAFQYWNEAQDLRESSQGLFPKVPWSESINNVPWKTTEWTTRTQLVELENNPLSYTSSYKRKFQAILVSRRILSRISSKAFVHHLWEGPTQRFYSDLKGAEELDVCWALLEGARAVTDPVDDDLREMIVKISCRLVSTLKKLQTYRSPVLNSETLKLSLQLVSDRNTSPFAINEEDHRVFTNCLSVAPLCTVYELFTILAENKEIMTNEIKHCLQLIVKRDDRGNTGCNLLLSACYEEQLWKPSSRKLIRLLLELGADPNVKDLKGNSPLHVVSTCEYDSPSSADLLFEYGADRDQRNAMGQTPLDVWKSAQRRYPQRLAPMWATGTVPSLAFWCARSLRRSQIPVDLLPNSLRKFVLHPK